MPVKFLNEQVYAEAMESMIVVTVDVVFIDRTNKKIFLATRKAKPMAELWVIGGRLLASEKEKAGMVRVIKRETSLDITPERLQFLCMNRYINPDRKQAPQDKGSDSLSYTFALELTVEEIAIASAKLDPEEYETEKGLQEFNINALEALPHLHPAILAMYRKVFV
jgi:ADP-ribose pyrophosphatase YjhB (NUDIX family)